METSMNKEYEEQSLETPFEVSSSFVKFHCPLFCGRQSCQEY